MSKFSSRERFIASMLSSAPVLKNSVKRVYVTLNAFLHRKKYTFKILDSRIEKIETPFENSESFGGYYDRPTIFEGKILSCLTDFPTKNNPSERQRIKLVANNQIIDMTAAYNWQQGCKAQWLDNDKIIYNVFENGIYASKVFSSRENKVVKIFSKPNQDSFKTDFFLSVNYSRIMNLRPDYGYRNLPLLSENEMKDIEHDGIFKVDYNSGDAVLLHSLKQITECNFKSLFNKCQHVANHLMINSNGSGFIFIHRFYEGKIRHDTLMFSDFKTLKVLADENMVSHCHWIDNENVFGFLRHNNNDGFFYINTITGEITEEKKLTSFSDGHPSCYGHWITFDTYPDKSRMQTLYLFNMKTKELYPLLELFHPLKYMNQTRCDLHPRFSSEGKYISFDTVFSGKRTQCFIDVQKIVS